MKQRVEDFKKLLENHQFFDAHEVLEELWFPIRHTNDDYCLVLKGFVNSAVSLELYKRGRFLQSQKVFLNYKKYVTIDRLDTTKYSKEFYELKNFVDEFFLGYVDYLDKR
jgi:hypothetical protein